MNNLQSYLVTRANFDEKEFSRGFDKWYEQEKPFFENHEKGRLEALNKYNEQMALAEKMKTQATQLYTQANQFYEKANQLATQSKEMKSEVAQERIEIANKKEEIAKEKQILMTKQFFSIFNGKKLLPTEKVELIYNTYLSDNSMTVEKANEKNYSRLNSMKAVTKYLDENPHVKVLDFRILKSEINDIPTLSDYLAKSNIKAVAINSGISSQAKESLNKAIEARKGTLKVQYFA